MTRRRKITLTVASFVLVLLGYSISAILRHGFSAREKPSSVEAFLAGHARRIATPSDAKTRRNPFAPSPENLAEARHHFAEHCAVCHGNDGRANVTIGRNLYPKAPDMTDYETQKLTDGELFYIISNGVRFTGMPAWGGEDSPEDIWKLVLFIRHLPQLTPDELKLMEMSQHEPHDERTTHAEPGVGNEKRPTHEHMHPKPH